MGRGFFKLSNRNVHHKRNKMIPILKFIYCSIVLKPFYPIIDYEVPPVKAILMSFLVHVSFVVNLWRNIFDILVFGYYFFSRILHLSLSLDISKGSPLINISLIGFHWLPWIDLIFLIIIHQIFLFALDWSKCVRWLNMCQLKLGNVRVIFFNFQNCESCVKDVKNNDLRSLNLHLARKYARIFVLGYYLLLDAHSLPLFPEHSPRQSTSCWKYLRSHQNDSNNEQLFLQQRTLFAKTRNSYGSPHGTFVRQFIRGKIWTTGHWQLFTEALHLVEVHRWYFHDLDTERSI